MTDMSVPGDAGGFERRARENQAERNAKLKTTYDFIIYGAQAALSRSRASIAFGRTCARSNQEGSMTRSLYSSFTENFA